jgi:hypothetical protein
MHFMGRTVLKLCASYARVDACLTSDSLRKVRSPIAENRGGDSHSHMQVVRTFAVSEYAQLARARSESA